MLDYLSMKYYGIVQGKASSIHRFILQHFNLLRWLATFVSCLSTSLYCMSISWLCLPVSYGLHGEHTDIHLNMYNKFPAIPLLFE